ncbi:hypothetical protein BU23DRAFT_585423 [Bimuria novae-zelandiae CBS 107.79]|uniref:Apple domain-containing protein n=1 Tax=Bimuria novae-zelandiae CBS 107.79 TaxID=1447943 RepID=A0A6A5UJ89_9PLEO|nr:hypothetical protein BU23DRAFT_585423 [Bimuria novae-zelandiae CBS 107.79]
MKASFFLGAALAAGSNAAAIEARQRPRPTSTQADIPDVIDCGLDSFVGHTSEALKMCSSILKSGTATQTATATVGTTTTVKTTIIIMLYPPTTSSQEPGRPTTSTRGPTFTPRPTTSSTLSTSSRLPTTSSRPPTTSSLLPTTSSKPTTVQSPTPSPTPTAGCGIVGYTKDTAAYYFDSSGTKNTFAACSAACKADSQCKSFGYGEANCMLFTVDATSNTNYNPMSPYTFYNVNCPVELPVRKRQADISLGLGISSLSSACSCLITSGPAGTTKTTSVTVTSKATATQTVTRTVSLLPGDLVN